MADPRHARLLALQRRLDETGTGLAVVGIGDAQRALLDVAVFPLERAGALLVTPTAATLVLPRIDASELDADALGVAVSPWSDEEGAARGFARALEALALPARPRVAFDELLRMHEHAILSAQLEGHSPASLRELLAPLRQIKDDDELRRIRAAADHVSAVVEHVFSQARAGITERELLALARTELIRRGVDSPDNVYVAIGANAAHVKHLADDTPLTPGSAALLDVAVPFDGYFADITRQLALGRPPAPYLEAYGAITAALDAGVAAVAPGATAHDVDVAVDAVLRDAELAHLRKHRSGHGLGTFVHEPPSLLTGNHTELTPGTVIAIEPAIYDEGGFGIRLEDTVLVTAGGRERLTTAARELRILG